ncbi:Oidioi.mRNA.OKI2018_I69.XSR.g14144.t1.cds [Oikopleura dioica]|uniref:Oidioi.mRNA.OKI2018_I69.XSR.g14144.t1.cds n=1 Tax=Oikopleura dioica TaxID=34765 RepID=A0ABN7SHP9_OIKDI|nr:Oidioi.mRNA.OKI2018_I69.XSR.g14144.t1.cds [Oikopleura dioica]
MLENSNFYASMMKILGICSLCISFGGMFVINLKKEKLLSIYIGFLSALIFIIASILHALFIRLSYSFEISDIFDYKKDSETIINLQKVELANECCFNTEDWTQMGLNVTDNDKELLQMACTSNNDGGDEFIQRIEYFTEDCVPQVSVFLTEWFIYSIALTVTLLISFIVKFLFVAVYHIRLSHGFEDEEDKTALVGAEQKAAIHSFKAFAKKSGYDLLPELFQINRSSQKVDFGLRLEVDNYRDGIVIKKVKTGSPAEEAGIKEQSRIIEIDGVQLNQNNLPDARFKLEAAGKVLTLLLISEEVDETYSSKNIDLNRENIAGVTLDLQHHPRIIKITKNEHFGFGFRVLSLQNGTGQYVEEVVKGSPAYKAGLQNSDRLIEIDGKRVSKLDVGSASRQTVELLVLSPECDSFFRRKGVQVTRSLAKNMKSKSSRVAKPRYCRLVKLPSEDFGLYVVIDNERVGQIVKWVDVGGVADRGGLRLGDRVVEINGINCEYESHTTITKLILSGENICHLIVVAQEYDMQYKRALPRLTKIYKEDGQLGFCIYYDQDRDGHYVEEVDAGGPAERAGLKIGDRIIQLNGMSVENANHDAVLQKLRNAPSEVSLLVAGGKSDTHYRNIVQFKTSGMDELKNDERPVPEQPIFFTKDEHKDDFVGTEEGESISGFSKLHESADVGVPRLCDLVKLDSEGFGFFLAIDRDREAQIVKRIEADSPARRAGLKDGDRVLEINGIKCDSMGHEAVAELIKNSGNHVKILVLDQKSDQNNIAGKPLLCRLQREKDESFGFTVGTDLHGHYFATVNSGSIAESSGLRVGDRIIELNHINIEHDSPEDVAVRIKSSNNVLLTLSIDTKSFHRYKREKIPITSILAELSKSSKVGRRRNRQRGNFVSNSDVTETSVTVRTDITIFKFEDEDFGFKLARSSGFEESDSSHIIHWLKRGGAAEYFGVRDGDKVLKVDGTDVTAWSVEEVVQYVESTTNGEITLTLEFKEVIDQLQTKTIRIARRAQQSFGFHLWFDADGHFFEDVTIGSPADRAGLKIGDRLGSINAKNPSKWSHEELVDYVRSKCTEEVTLQVLSIANNDEFSSATQPLTVTLTRGDNGSFGFKVTKDAKGFYVEYVQPNGAADQAGVSVGDRLIELDESSLDFMDMDELVQTIQYGGNKLKITLLAKASKSRVRKNPEDTAIFDALHGNVSIDYEVQPRLLQRKPSWQSFDS